MAEEPWLSWVGASVLMQMDHMLVELHFLGALACPSLAGRFPIFMVRSELHSVFVSHNPMLPNCPDPGAHIPVPPSKLYLTNVT